MTDNQRIISVLAPFGDPVAPQVYTGAELRYYTFNFDVIPTGFAGNCPAFWKVLAQIHFFCPLEENSLARRTATAKALEAAGLGWPEVIDASDKDGQHFVFECEYISQNERMEDI